MKPPPLKINSPRANFNSIIRDRAKTVGTNTVNMLWSDDLMVYRPVELQETNGNIRTGNKTTGIITDITKINERAIITLRRVGQFNFTDAIEVT